MMTMILTNQVVCSPPPACTHMSVGWCCGSLRASMFCAGTKGTWIAVVGGCLTSLVVEQKVALALLEGLVMPGIGWLWVMTMIVTDWVFSSDGGFWSPFPEHVQSHMPVSSALQTTQGIVDSCKPRNNEQGFRALSSSAPTLHTALVHF